MAISVFDMRKCIVHIALLHKFLLCNLKCLENDPLTDEKGDANYLVLPFWMERGGRTGSTAYGGVFLPSIRMMGVMSM